MALFTISDLHLSTLDSTDKSMEVFGLRWKNYVNRLEKNWRSLVSERDTVVIGGDISWALSLNEALCDLKFIDSLPGRKILLKGNHDFWWTTMKKHREFFESNSINSISFLFNNAHEVENYIIAGTRGWFVDEKLSSSANNTDFDKICAREELRLRSSLEIAKSLSESSGKEILVFTHFPPVFNGYTCEGLINILEEYKIKRLFFGHIHGNYTIPESTTFRDIKMSIVSADYLDFIPKIIV